MREMAGNVEVPGAVDAVSADAPAVNAGHGALRRKIHIKTYGCQMNVYDTNRMTDAMAPHGYEEVDAPEKADVVILNTCHIRERAAEKVYSELGRLRKMKDARGLDGERVIIGVAGCVAQAEGDEIRRRAPAVDLVFGPQTYHRLPEMIARADNGGPAVVDTEFPTQDKFGHLPAAQKKRTLARGATAFLTVQEGCDKFCTFCVVPYTRGAEFSRPVALIEEEARNLVAAGVREITLLGQNVNAYHGDAPGGGAATLGVLIRALGEIEGLERIRFTTSHPRDMDDDLIAAHGEDGKLMPYLHLPVQSGSDRILDLMNRQHTVEFYMEIIGRIRAARPDIALSSDFIVGFPGETDEDFEATLKLVREVKFAQAYSFKYSPRPGTPAAGEADQVPEDVKSERLARLQAALNETQLEFNEACVGRVMPVLFDRRGRQQAQLIGRSPYLQSVHVENVPEHLFGQLASVFIEQGHANSLKGRLVAEAGSAG